jgi:hypothetical protein
MTTTGTMRPVSLGRGEVMTGVGEGRSGGVAPAAELLLLEGWPHPLAEAGTRDTEGSKPLFSA